jgi:hypothetical protein
VGAAIGYGVSSQNRWRRYLVPLGGYVLVALTHGQQDYIVGKVLNMTGAVVGAGLIQILAGLPSPDAIDGTPWLYVSLMIGSTIGLVGINLINIPILFWSLWRSGEAERQVIRDQLVDEPKALITPDEYAGVVAERRRRRRSLSAYPAPIGRAIVQRQNELAFRKAYVQRQGKAVEGDRPAEMIRATIVQLRNPP